MPRTRSFLPRTVVVLGAVSLLNDTASDMIMPLLPVFLTAVLGAGPAVVGLIEGVAEATASVLKLVSGRLADRGLPRRRLVVGGYALSNLVRPLIGLAPGWSWVLAMRFADRVGKGIRTAPRDALISAAVEAPTRGRAFGFHRALDHAGAMLGPLLAFALLQLGASVPQVFLASVVPGVLVLVLLFTALPHEPPRAPVPLARLSWRGLDPQIRGLVVGAGGLALATVPDAFMVLWAAERGIEVVWLPLLWAAAHAGRAVIATPGGLLADRIGRLPVVVAGWSARVVLLLVMAGGGDGPLTAWAMFIGYAAATAFGEGAERALVGDRAPADQKATAFGLYHLFSGLLALPGALLFGGVWQWVGMNAAFVMAAALTAISAGVFYDLARRAS
jgi:MFS family permease